MTTARADLPTLFRAAADLIVAVHVAFVVFVVLGGLLVVRWPRLVWVHVSAAAWGVLIEFAGWICPLTPLENYLRQRAGLSTYQGDFIERYVMPLLYPAHLTRTRQVWLGTAAVIVNILVYWRVVRQPHAEGRSRRGES
jgi:uncharacterized protein DUF2784